MSVAAAKRSSDTPLKEACASHKKHKEKGPEDRFSSLPTVVMENIYTMLGKEIFAFSTASRDRRAHLYETMRAKYSQAPQLAGLVEEGSRSALDIGSSGVAGGSSSLQRLAMSEIPAIYKRIVQESDKAWLHFGLDYSPTLNQLGLAEQKLRDSTLPFPIEGPPKYFVNPLDTNALSMRLAATETAGYDKVIRRARSLFIIGERGYHVSNALGLISQIDIFQANLTADCDRNISVLFSENIDLLMPVFISFIKDPMRFSSFCSLLKKHADSKIGPEKGALLEFVLKCEGLMHEAYKPQIVRLSDPSSSIVFDVRETDAVKQLSDSAGFVLAIRLKELFLRGIKNSSLSYSTLGHLFENFLTFRAKLERLGDKNHIHGYDEKPAFVEAENFFIALQRRQLVFSARLIERFLDQSAVKDAVQKRDEFLIYNQIALEIPSHAHKRIYFYHTALQQEIDDAGTELSQEKFTKKITDLKKIVTLIDEEYRNFAAEQAKLELDAIRERLLALDQRLSETKGEAKDLADQVLISEYLQILQTIKTFAALQVEISADFYRLVHAQCVSPLSDTDFDAKLQDKRQWLERPDVQQLCMLLTNLDFSWLGISSFPAGLLSRFPRLETLDISNNALSAVPDEVESLKKLAVFTARKNYITEVPSFVWGLPNLSSLDFQGCYISKLVLDETTFFAATEKPPLRSLNVRGNCLVSIPEGFLSFFPELRMLDFSSNQLRSLPKDLSSFMKIPSNYPKELFFNGNLQLRQASIPPDVWDSTTPTVLKLMKELKYYEKTRMTDSKTALSTFTKAYVLKCSDRKLLELFSSLSGPIQTVIGLGVWNFWHDWREDAIGRGVVLTGPLGVVHALDATLSLEEKASHGIEHLNDKNILNAVLNNILRGIYLRLSPEQKQALFRTYPHFAHSAGEDPEHFPRACFYHRLQFIDALSEIIPEGIEAFITENLVAIAANRDWPIDLLG